MSASSGVAGGQRHLHLGARLARSQRGELALQVLDLAIDLADLDLRLEDRLLRLGRPLADQLEQLAPVRLRRGRAPPAGGGVPGSLVRFSISFFWASAAWIVVCSADFSSFSFSIASSMRRRSLATTASSAARHRHAAGDRRSRSPARRWPCPRRGSRRRSPLPADPRTAACARRSPPSPCRARDLGAGGIDGDGIDGGGALDLGGEADAARSTTRKGNPQSHGGSSTLDARSDPAHLVKARQRRRSCRHFDGKR